MLSNTAVPREYGAFRDAVLRGEIPVNREISMQMNRIDDDIANPEFFYDDKAIQGYIDFCENELTLVDGSDLVLLPTFKLWAEDLLAWYHYVDKKVFDPITGKFKIVRKKQRLRNKQYLIVARGNSKSLYQTTIHAYSLIMDTSSTHQVTVAPTMAQSREILEPLATAITRSRGPLFKALTQGNNKSRVTYSQAKLAKTKNGIENKITNSLLQILPMSKDKLQGYRSKVATVDEWLSGNIREDVITALEQSASKSGIDDYTIIAVSSEGTVRDSVGDSIKMELLSILKGERYDPHTSIWYYRLDDIHEINDPDMWMKASPNIGVTVSYDTYQRDLEVAETVPVKRNDILAKRFGIPVEGHTYFFTYEEIQLHSPQNYDGMACSMGMDASQGDDFWAFSWLFPLGRGALGVKVRAYICQRKYLSQTSATRQKYDELIAEGTLIVFEGAMLDWGQVYEDVLNYIYSHDWSVLSFGYDPYNASAFVDRWCMENGSHGVMKVRQGVRTESVPLGELKALASERLLIFDEETMKFSMGNSIVIQDNNGNYKLNKRRAEDKIDNVASTMDALVAYKEFKESFE